MAISTTLSTTELTRRLHTSVVLREGAIPQGLRENGVEAVYLKAQPNDRFRVVLEGLRTSVRPSMEVEGLGQFITDSSGKTSIRVEIVPKTSSLWRVGITVAVLLGLTVITLVFLDPPDRFAFILPVFAGALVLVSWLQVRSLTERAWPGLMVAVNRLLVDDKPE